MAFLKFIVVAGLMVLGAFFIAKGLGVALPVVKYKGLEAYNFPAGALLLATGVAVTYFWKVTKTKTSEVTVTVETPQGKKTTTTRTETEITTLAEPLD
jgi:hypothetical protein